jgi:formamidopyrimidine-DNA glycosylase
MPELPEVETTVRDLDQKVRNRTFIDVWTDFGKMIKSPGGFQEFRKNLLGKAITSVYRRGKNILFSLSGGYVLLVHQKLTGHLLYGNWTYDGKNWVSAVKGDLSDPINRYIHLVFSLDGGKQIALSDLRKFAKTGLWKEADLYETKEIKELGPEPLYPGFTFAKFREALGSKKGKIKQILMDQSVIVGIGNIYSDEILWSSKIHPARPLQSLGEEELKTVYGNTLRILVEAIKLRGTTIVSNAEEYRGIGGRRGRYQEKLNVYRLDGTPCRVCGRKLERIKANGRSWHFCPKCQK